MSTDWVVDMGSEALFLIIKTAAPILLVSLAVGLIVSIFQTVTSIQEQTLTFVPKILAVFLTLMLLGGWILDSISGYMIELWSNLFGLWMGITYTLRYNLQIFSPRQSLLFSLSSEYTPLPFLRWQVGYFPLPA